MLHGEPKNHVLNETDANQANEYARLMLDASPLVAVLLDGGYQTVGCNEAAVELLGALNKENLLERFPECSPEYQPDGERSADLARYWIDKAFAEGRCSFEWTHKALDGMLLPSEVTLVRVEYGNGYLVAGYARDTREYKRMMREIEHKSLLLQTVNRISALILKSNADSLEENLHTSMGILAEAADADRVYVWRNYEKNGNTYCSQIYEWSGRAEPQMGKDFTEESEFPAALRETMSQGRCINQIVSELPESAQAVLTPQRILSVLFVPIFLDNQFWGFVGFDDCHSERVFSENEEIILRSASELIAGALSRTRMETEAEKIFYDSLTGIYNRRFFDENSEKTIQTLSRAGASLSLMMIDIDYFKRYNDAFGHVEGDNCLKAVAEALSDSLTRADDFVARYGGEEFVAVLPNTGESGARLVAGKLIENVRAKGIIHEENAAGYVTISVGVTSGRVGTRGVKEFVERADEMLYAAKQGGRNGYAFGSF